MWLTIALLVLGTSDAATDSTLRCQARGPREWLATRPSPLDSTTLAVGGARVRVCYSRPALRGRAVDSLLPAGNAWRAGANEPTTVTLTAPLELGGAALAAGRYVLLVVPRAERWDLVFNTTSDTEPGRMFATMRPVAQGSGRAVASASPVDRFTIRADERPGEAALIFEWGERRIRVPVRPAP